MFENNNAQRASALPARLPLLDRSQRRAIVARYACTRRTMAHAYHVRYRGYLSHGYIAPHETEQLTDQFDDVAKAPSVVVYDDEQPVGTLRLCSYDPAKTIVMADALPSAALFELTPAKIRRRFGLKRDQMRLTEVSKLAKMPEYESDLVITMALFKMLKVLVAAAASEIVFVAVRVQHMRLYQRLGFEVIEAPRLFAKNNVVLGLMACRPNDFGAIEDRAEKIFREPDALKAAELAHTAEQFFKGRAVDVFPAPSFVAEPLLTAPAFASPATRPATDRLILHDAAYA